MTIAVAIGLHNFAEGLAIGVSARAGAIGLATMLIIGFALHNATEGFGIVGPLGGARPSWRGWALAGLVGGGPTFLGAMLGYQVHSGPLELAFYALAGGAILYVIGEIWAGMRRYSHRELGLYLLAAGFLLGDRDRPHRQLRRRLNPALAGPARLFGLAAGRGGGDAIRPMLLGQRRRLRGNDRAGDLADGRVDAQLERAAVHSLLGGFEQRVERGPQPLKHRRLKECIRHLAIHRLSLVGADVRMRPWVAHGDFSPGGDRRAPAPPLYGSVRIAVPRRPTVGSACLAFAREAATRCPAAVRLVSRRHR